MRSKIAEKIKQSPDYPEAQKRVKKWMDDIDKGIVTSILSPLVDVSANKKSYKQ